MEPIAIARKRAERSLDRLLPRPPEVTSWFGRQVNIRRAYLKALYHASTGKTILIGRGGVLVAYVQTVKLEPHVVDQVPAKPTQQRLCRGCRRVSASDPLSKRSQSRLGVKLRPLMQLVTPLVRPNLRSIPHLGQK